MPRKTAHYQSPPQDEKVPPPDQAKDPLAFLDEMDAVLTLDVVAKEIKRSRRSCLEDPTFPRLPYSKKEIVVLREELRAWLQQRRTGTATAAFLSGARLTPSPLSDDLWARLLRMPKPDAVEWLADVRGEGVPRDG